ncbi:MAG: TldD/PmbA family protein [Candidatus Heimdallarchaeota archaeon]|nr:TldD/PmbA family protein [Candidatus Heimdallarchaeota archaeon]MDH5646912.1 TldD/PmbA family protein [Candidatus Heimdallarchaeota archaeon]
MEDIKQHAYIIMNEAKKQGAEHIQVRYTEHYRVGTRYGEKHITQNISTTSKSFELRTQIGGKVGTYNGSYSPDLIEKSVADALLLTRVSEDDTEFPGFVQEKYNYRPKTAKYHELEPDILADEIKIVIDKATSMDSRITAVAGNLHYQSTKSCLINSFGLEVDEESSGITGVINVCATDSGESRSTTRIAGATIKALNIEERTESVTNTAIQGLNQGELEPGKYETILSPEAVAELMRFIAFGASSEGLITHQSFLKDKLGEQIFDERITLIDDVENPEQNSSRRYDSEGVASNNVSFIENGVLKDYAYNRRNAKKLGVESNGRHLFGFMGESAMFVTQHLKAGNKSREELVSSIDDGILVSNLFYNNFVNPPEGLCTGLTRDGLFRIKNGEIIGSLKNMRWTDNITSILSVAEPGSDIRQVADLFGMTFMTPSVRVGQFNYSSKGKH